jgi:D-threo-aldose 1-dehydrogenase
MSTQTSRPSRIGFASRIGFGASGLGTLYRLVSDRQAEETLEAAYAAGMRYFDTAPLYGHGLSELRLGRFLRSLPRDGITVSTKVGRYMVPPYGEPVDYGLWADPLRLKPVFDYSYDGTMRALEQSANRMGFADLNLVYIHDVDRFTHSDAFERMFDDAMEGCYRALDDLRKAGHIKAIGVGVNEGDVATRFIRAGNFDAVMIAGRYTLLDQSALNDLLPAALEKDVEIVAAGVFNSGILATKPDDGRPLTYDYAAAPDAMVARRQRLVDICAAHGVPVQAAALQFPFSHPAVSAIVIGMSQPGRVAENMGYAATPIPAALWHQLRDEGLLDPRVIPPAAP